MRLTTIHIISFALLLSFCNNENKINAKYDPTNDSLTLIMMVRDRESAMKSKNISAVMDQFDDDATFINGGGYYFANKKEIAEFHKALIENDSISYHYKAGNVHVRVLDDKNALVYYPNRMDWFKVSNYKDTIEKETRLLTLSAQKRSGKWKWIAITNQQTAEYFEDLTNHKLHDLNESLKDTTQNK